MTDVQPAAEANWYIQASGRVWGPYAEERLAGFKAEKRLTAQSLVSRRPDGPFGPAAGAPELAFLFDEVAEVAGAGASAPTTYALLVWADLASQAHADFEATLEACGGFAAIQPGLWLVRARGSAATLRNTLSRRLDGRDVLIVVEAPLDRAAWFNLGPEQERSLRALWGG